MDQALSAQQRAWRWRVLIATFLGYAGYYFCRKVFGLVKTSLNEEFDWPMDAIAYLWAAYLCAYMVGQFVNGFIGRKWGPRLLDRFPRYRPPVDVALGFLRKYNTWFILSFRFIYGIRNVSSFAMGLSGLSWTRFLVLNFIAAGLWACTFAGSGYILGKAFSALLGDLAESFGLVMLGIFLIVVSGVVIMHKRLQQREAALLRRKLAEDRAREERDRAA